MPEINVNNRHLQDKLSLLAGDYDIMCAGAG
jgi:hypothetical protein